jgi:hypothetical protein
MKATRGLKAVHPCEGVLYTSVQYVVFVVAGCPSALRTENQKYAFVNVSLSFQIGDRAERTYARSPSLSFVFLSL